MVNEGLITDAEPASYGICLFGFQCGVAAFSAHHAAVDRSLGHEEICCEAVCTELSRINCAPCAFLSVHFIKLLTMAHNVVPDLVRTSKISPSLWTQARKENLRSIACYIYPFH